MRRTFLKDSKERLSVTGKMTERWANAAGVMLAFGAMGFLLLTGAAALIAAL
jgi:hypothetical protein